MYYQTDIFSFQSRAVSFCNRYGLIYNPNHSQKFRNDRDNAVQIDGYNGNVTINSIQYILSEGSNVKKYKQKTHFKQFRFR